MSKSPVPLPLMKHGMFECGKGKRARVDAIAYRSGLGRVALLRTSVPEFGLGCYSLVPSKKVPRLNRDDNDHELFAMFINNVIIATERQATPEWFVARRFRVTGTSALTLFKHVMGQPVEHRYNSQSLKLILDVLGFTEHSTYNNSDKDVLSKKTKEQLSVVLRNNNLSTTGNKQALIDRIINHDIPICNNEEEDNGVSLTVKLMKDWLLVPFQGNGAFFYRDAQ